MSSRYISGLHMGGAVSTFEVLNSWEPIFSILNECCALIEASRDLNRQSEENCRSHVLDNLLTRSTVREWQSFDGADFMKRY
ncbi:hypothetical protein E4U39_006629 [Claviceps sp. Clav50 group G5]|nr:hypothetical protein E4U39_006629 [Claviceps sp. Clav50 group G5]